MPLPEGAKVEKADESKDAETAKRPLKASTIFTAAVCLETGGDRTEGLKRQHQYDQAMAAYKQALQLDPKFTSATARIARLHEKMGQVAVAEAHFLQAVKDHPDDPSLWCELGMFHGRQKRFDQAVECLGRAVSLEPESQIYANHLGWGLARAGRFDESFEHFRRTLGPARAHYNLARMARHLKQEDLCQQHLQAALQIEPQLADARRMLEQQAGPVEDPAVIQVGGQPEEPVTTP